MDISIVLPVYNKARYLPSLLDDLRAQTFQRFECILVDDGSADGSGSSATAPSSRTAVFGYSILQTAVFPVRETWEWIMPGEHT